jgi:hypothetical protein
MNLETSLDPSFEAKKREADILTAKAFESKTEASLNIAQTPTLQVVASGDERRLVDDLQNKIDEALQLVEQSPEVLKAKTALDTAAQQVARFKTAERTLNQWAKDLGERISAAREKALDGLVEAAGSGDKPDFKPATEVAALENRSRHTTKTIERLVERLIPLAEIAKLREESHAALTRAKALERIAEERARRIIEHLHGAVSEEIVLPVDFSKGVSGALLAYATEYKAQAVQLSERADQMEKAFGLLG